MKNYFSLLLTCLVLFSASTKALEIDEKLTIRILDASASKKTVLINRGLEDGLVVGDHAKFFITQGVIARGVVVKASPTRSIWSVYRLISPQELNKGLVANIKISTSVKLTADSSKAIRALSVPAGSMGEPNDIFPNKAMDKGLADTDEVKALMNEGDSQIQVVETAQNSPQAKRSALHSLEISALISVASLSGTYTDTANDGSFDASNSSMNFTGSIEKYFPTSTSFLKNFSLKLNASRLSQESGFGVNNVVTLTDLGGGVSYYFGQGPHRSNALLYFADANFGISNGTIEIQDNVDTNSSTNTTKSFEGTGTHMSFGVGAKYLVGNQFGAIGKLDYYSNTTSYDVEGSNGDITTDELAYSGPRVMFGLFYRFF